MSNIIRLRFTRSTSAPSNSPKSRYGTNSDAVVMARFVAERVSSKTSRGSAKRVKELPTCEVSWPVKYSQKSRPRELVIRPEEVTRSMLPSPSACPRPHFAPRLAVSVPPDSFRLSHDTGPSAAASESMSLVDLGHVHPVNEVVILDRDWRLSRFGHLPGVCLGCVVAIQFTDLYLFTSRQREAVSPRPARRRSRIGHDPTIARCPRSKPPPNAAPCPSRRRSVLASSPRERNQLVPSPQQQHAERGACNHLGEKKEM